MQVGGRGSLFPSSLGFSKPEGHHTGNIFANCNTRMKKLGGISLSVSSPACH
jgi:hypothetical protein